MHIAALQQGGLAWPCPAWLRTPESQHEAAQPGKDGLIIRTKSSADVNELGRRQAVNHISTNDVVSRDDASDTSSSTSDDITVNNAAGNVHEQHIAHAQTPPSLINATSSGSSGAGSISSDGHDTSDSNSGSSGSDASNSSSDTEQSPVGQQAAFEKLDSLFASSAASGAVSTHLAALDLLKRVPAVKARPGSSTGADLSAAQPGMKLRKQGHQPQQQQQKQWQTQVHQQPQQQQQQQQLSRADKASKPRPDTSAMRGKGSSRKGAGLADAEGGKEPHKAEWVQMQDGGNPLYLHQKHGLPGEGEHTHACSYAHESAVHACMHA